MGTTALLQCFLRMGTMQNTGAHGGPPGRHVVRRCGVGSPAPVCGGEGVVLPGVGVKPAISPSVCGPSMPRRATPCAKFTHPLLSTEHPSSSAASCALDTAHRVAAVGHGALKLWARVSRVSV